MYLLKGLLQRPSGTGERGRDTQLIPKNLNLLDILALIILSLSTVAALLRGLSHEILSLLSAILAFLLAVFFYGDVARLYVRLGITSPLSDFLGFLTVFLSIMIAGSFLVMILDRALRTLHLKWLDRLLGGIFGLVRGWLVAAVVFLALATFPIQDDLLEQSQLADFFLSSVRTVVRVAPEDFRDKFDSGYEKVYELWFGRTHDKDS